MPVTGDSGHSAGASKQQVIALSISSPEGSVLAGRSSLASVGLRPSRQSFHSVGLPKMWLAVGFIAHDGYLSVGRRLYFIPGVGNLTLADLVVVRAHRPMTAELLRSHHRDAIVGISGDISSTVDSTQLGWAIVKMPAIFRSGHDRRALPALDSASQMYWQTAPPTGPRRFNQVNVTDYPDYERQRSSGHL